MIVKTYINGQLDVNSYLIHNNNECMVIDPGSDLPDLHNEISKKKLSLKAILLTHGHIDHIAGTSIFVDKYKAPVYIHRADEKMAVSLDLQSSLLNLPRPDDFDINYVIDDDKTINIGSFKVDVIRIGGHSEGSVCFLIENCLFSGDTLFNLVVGRTDLYGSTTQKELTDNISKKLFRALNNDIIVYPGHGPATTLGFEKKNNLYVRA